MEPWRSFEHHRHARVKAWHFVFFSLTLLMTMLGRCRIPRLASPGIAFDNEQRELLQIAKLSVRRIAI